MTPRVAIACSGLGHVVRGNETWSATVAEGIHKSGGNVILFGSGPRPDARSPYVRVPCWRRDGWLRRWLSWDKAYLFEQVTFARNLRQHLRSDRFDIVHTADPNLAQQLIKTARRNKLALIYQDSLFIGPAWCSKFSHVQVLAPYYLDAARAQNVETGGWRVIPQLVDTRAFTPATDKAALRQRLFQNALPDSAKAILAVGDFSPRGNKRIDWIIDEVSQCKTNPHLILAGQASAADIERTRSCGAKLNQRLHLLANLAHKEMPSVFSAADMLIHAATSEPFGLALIEAMASGLPVLGHTFPVTQWIIGEGGQSSDMTKKGELAAAIDGALSNETLRAQMANAALQRARNTFDKDKILPMYHAWYNELASRR